ncbi:FdhF/YdeP family oxidoreductase [Thalassotalea ponticola]|uniref:FdhF/YdeP family oxidoreductase n=1 Tax=Thalassotalea ponticola TaxID=1523392 RepID=UPI0025B3E493|nr:FdhF/YdeP family oxidoreductase [Thalassotalea ponticola]MDN3653355.1 FdhF/YdeP family oxidoreductase [Thalassotalea ponticola]
MVDTVNKDNADTQQKAPRFTDKPAKAGGIKSLQSTLKSIINSQQPSTNIKSLLKANQDKGFDCPGCAWGDEKKGLIQFCENGAKAIAWESTSKTIGEAFFSEYSVSQLRKQSDYWLEYQGRLAQPMRYNKETDHYQPISWDDAFEHIADQLSQLDHANQLELYTSGRASNEAAFIYQLFGRIFGTNNFPDCSNMCHEASGVALKEAIGIGKGTVTLSDFDQADAIFVFGQNPGSNHPRMMNALRKAARHGCKIVTFNNLKEVALERFASPQDPIELLTPSATQISHAYYTPKLGGDMAAVRGMVKAILEQHEHRLDETFISQHTSGLDAYVSEVNNTPWSKICEQSGLTEEQIRQAASIWADSDKVIVCWAMGITQHKHSVATIGELVNLQLLAGHIGKLGAGLCPVRGHSNVQGNRTVGINEKPPAAFIDSLSHIIDKPLDKAFGHNVHQALHALLDKRSKVLICLGGNIAQAAPDSERVYQALGNTQLNVQIATKLNRSHLYMGDDAVILPCLGRTEIDRQTSGEQYISVEDTFSMVHASMGNVEPVSSLLRSEVAIIAGIANKVLGNDLVDWSSLAADYKNIRAMISACLPDFNNYESRLDNAGGFYLGNSAREHNWLTETKKATFACHPLPISVSPIADTAVDENMRHKVLTLQTLRSHDQYNTTIYGMNDRYRGVAGGRNVVFINHRDAKKQGLSDGDLVTITSIWPDSVERKVDGFKVHVYDIPEGNIAAYYPETNPLIPLDSIGDKSSTPTSKSVAVYLTRQTTARII